MEKDLKILLLEDSIFDADLAERTMRKAGITFDSRRVDERDEFIEAVGSFEPDVILSDHSLPQFNSLEALVVSKKMGFRGPFILVTGAVSDEFAVNCLKMGADDYVLKSNLPRLPASIRNALKQHQVRRQQIEAEWALRSQNEELVKINKELDSFVYSVSHNLRAPLMSVLGLVDLAHREDQANGNRLSDYFKMMEASIGKLDDTLHEILDYSRNARSDLQVSEVDIKALIDENLKKIKFLSGYDRVRQTIHYEIKMPLFSDAYRISIILTNLFSNAIKYSDRKKEHSYLHIKANVLPERFELVVSDNGVGIESEFHDRIFDMFFRANEDSDGAGLGLYIVREAIRKLAGQIRVESVPLQGTTFIITLPNYTSEKVSPS